MENVALLGFSSYLVLARLGRKASVFECATRCVDDGFTGILCVRKWKGNVIV